MELAVLVVCAGPSLENAHKFHEVGRQEESTAKFYFMSRSVIETGLIDHILAPGKMAKVLVKYIKHLTVT